MSSRQRLQGTSRLVQYGFTAGIVSKTLWSQTVLQKYGYGLADCRNYIIEFSGALVSRPGTLADRILPMAMGKNYRLVPFIFAQEDQNTYELCFVANKIYFFQQGAYQLEAGKAVTAISSTAAYTQFTCTAHGYAVGDLIEFYGADVPAAIQGQTVVVSTVVNSNSFRCQLINHAVSLDSWTDAATSAVMAYRCYALATSYGELDLPGLYFSQARDVVEITSGDFDPMELARQSDGTWTLTETSFSLETPIPTGLVLVKESTADDNREAMWAVSAVTDGGESLPCEPQYRNALSDAGSVTLTWDAVAGALKYIIYRSILSSADDAAPRLTKGQSLGYMGTSFAPAYYSYSTIPDFTKAPKRNLSPFAAGGIDYIEVTNGGTGYVFNDTAAISDANGSGALLTLVVDRNSSKVIGVVVKDRGTGYTSPSVTITTSTGSGATFVVHRTPSTGVNPAISGLHQQRRLFGASLQDPMTLWGSSIGAFSTFNQGEIVADDDSYKYALATPILGTLKHLVSTRVGLLAFADIGVWQLTGSNGGSITPSDVQADPLSSVGCSNLVPLSIDSDILYAETANETVRLLQYNHYSQQFGGLDISTLAKDLFKGWFDLTAWSLERRPYKIVWACRNDGQLLCATISQEQEVYAWGRHDTEGLFEQNITIPETLREVTYVVTQRYLSGRWVNVLEHFADRARSSNENHCGVDCAIAFGGTNPSASLSFDGTTFVASAAIFSAGDVGKFIKYRTGKAIITTFNSSTSVAVTVINPFSDLEIPYSSRFKDIASGEWTLTTLLDSVKLPINFRPDQVKVFGDGKVFSEVIPAADGTVEFSESLACGYIGFGFECLAVTLPFAANGTIIEMSRKNLKGVGIRYVDSKGLEIGTSEDDTYPIEKIQHELMAEPTQLGSAMEEVAISSDWTEDTQLFIKADGAVPTQVTGFVIDLEVGDDVD